MRTLLFTLGLTAMLHAQPSPAPLKQGERDRAMSHMHATRKQFLDSLAGVTPAQWNFKPAPEVWSIAEVAEHIVLSEDLLFEIATKRALQSPPDPALATSPANDEKLLALVADRSKKAQAPEALQPRRSFQDMSEVITEFKKRRDRNIAYVQTTQDPLRAHASKHPLLGALDAYQWLLLLSAHSERHILQLNEVKQHPSFPK
jgi:hypothetical protein